MKKLKKLRKRIETLNEIIEAREAMDRIRARELIVYYLGSEHYDNDHYLCEMPNVVLWHTKGDIERPDFCPIPEEGLEGAINYLTSEDFGYEKIVLFNNSPMIPELYKAILKSKNKKIDIEYISEIKQEAFDLYHFDRDKSLDGYIA